MWQPAIATVDSYVISYTGERGKVLSHLLYTLMRVHLTADSSHSPSNVPWDEKTQWYAVRASHVFAYLHCILERLGQAIQVKRERKRRRVWSFARFADPSHLARLLSYFSHCYDQIPGKKQPKGRRVPLGSLSEGTGHQGREGMVARM